ncbi:sterol desaturase family protein [Flavobacterium sp. SUN052]|uniref:sterol desaturase family protein n=1 Tax=Flavobacterium sp. SUN052 TaxID=3002441 RepID=UPI00237DB917|nr:sterol desaturase family protein [Flavobacterium sp. SUN052]MEC4005702.1 sterol desaturase family protein [Flavobacterium sp. SUN052]
MREANRTDFYREIFHSLQSNLVITFFAVLVLFTPLRSHTLLYKPLSDYSIYWIPLSLVLSLIVHDTYFYWMHRLLHHKNIFRFAHLVHHQSTNPSPFTSYSFHFLEAITEGLVLFVIVFTIPMHPITLIIFGLLGFLINIYGHLGYEIMGKSFRYSFWFQIINSSVYHNLHHKKFHGNYGLYFRFWDRIMNTENPNYVKEYDIIQENRFTNTTN